MQFHALSDGERALGSGVAGAHGGGSVHSAHLDSGQRAGFPQLFSAAIEREKLCIGALQQNAVGKSCIVQRDVKNMSVERHTRIELRLRFSHRRHMAR